MIAYFSCTGNTETIASRLKTETGSDTFEIIPAVPYTAEDLNYNTDCRANREQNDKTARPEISNTIENYDIIYLGYPIWWGEEPRIIDTFLESYDFSGKTVIPFCTHGTGGLAGTVSDITEILPKDCTILKPIGISRSDISNCEDMIAEWLSELKLY
ncbi:MAG: flavodoxin [Clostridium sp.]|nr:flavodoxin [Clostridium sp.]